MLKLSENGVLENVNTKHFGDLRRGKDGKLYIASGNQAGQLQAYNSTGNNFLSETAINNIENQSSFNSYLPTQVFRQTPIKGYVYHRTVGDKYYELNDHLGNVHAVITDKKNMREYPWK